MENNFKEFSMVGKRRRLLPWWVKTFCWFFMFTGFLSIGLVVLVLLNKKPELAIYGIDADQNIPYNFVVITLVLLFHGATASLLWFERRRAIVIAKIDAIIGVVLCFMSMLISLVNGNFTVRLEIIFLILFFWKLQKIERQWNDI